MQFLTADGGGSKLVVIRYDQDFNILGVGHAGGTNDNFRSQDDIYVDMQKAVRECLNGEKPELEAADYLIVGSGDLFCRAIREETVLHRFAGLHEGQTALMAGTGETHGILALAGTGSDVFCIQPEGNQTVGGWGTILGDEGSGYDIGVASLRAAIYAEDGRGEYTLLLPMLKEAWGLNNLWDMVSPLYKDPDQRRKVASVCKITAQAANKGDKVAMAIYRHAAWELFRMTDVILQKRNGKITGPICTSGGVWKGCSIMREEYCRLIQKKYGHISVVSPVFDPCVGGVVHRALVRGMKKEDFWQVLKIKFKSFMY